MSPQQIKQIKRARAIQIGKLGFRAAALRFRGDTNGLLNLIANEFVKLGGIYIKFLQGIILQHPLMKGWQTESKYKIFENLETAKVDIIDLLSRELGTNLQEIETINPEPFAAGSFGQAYFATLRGGKEIVVKALRPGVRQTLKFDLRLLRLIITPIAGIFTTWDIDLKSSIKSFTEATLNETDYPREAAAAMKMRESYKENSQIVIPKTYEHLCSAQIITQDYVGGVSGAFLVEKYGKGNFDPKSMSLSTPAHRSKSSFQI